MNRGPLQDNARRAGASHKVLPGTGHACCIEDPAGFDALLIAFLEDRGLMAALEA